MKNYVKIFKNKELGRVRTVIIDGELWFVGKDVSVILGYAKPENAIAAHVENEDKTTTLIQGTGSNYKSKTTIINESGFYSLVLSSKMPRAKDFKHWVTSEILPTIRKTGGYVNDEDLFVETYLPFADEPVKNLFRLQMKVINQINDRIRHDEPLVEFANQVAESENFIDINAMAKLAFANDIRIGRNRLFRWLRSKKILMSDNIPYQKYIDSGYFMVKETVVDVGMFTKIRQQTLVT
ncbi:MAG: phage antirepressor KilAC domain-containing protein [Ruminococcus sp.]|nr:phage antirepressor KilAC domain-containing protein [Ruminococcus sp.]